MEGTTAVCSDNDLDSVQDASELQILIRNLFLCIQIIVSKPNSVESRQYLFFVGTITKLEMPQIFEQGFGVGHALVFLIVLHLHLQLRWQQLHPLPEHHDGGRVENDRNHR